MQKYISKIIEKLYIEVFGAIQEINRGLLSPRMTHDIYNL